MILAPVLQSPTGPEVMPGAEMIFHNDPNMPYAIVDYMAKWDCESSAYTSTQRTFELQESDGPLVDEIRAIAKKCWEAFALSGYVRVDLRVDTDGQPWVLEVNASLCIAPDSGFVAAAAQAGLDYTGIVSRIMGDAVMKERQEELVMA